MRGGVTHDYESLSNKDIQRIVREELPELEIDEVNDFNRETVIAYLKILDEE